MSTCVAFTDGAAKGNPGPGGYGAVVHCNGVVTELGAATARTTNNAMELQAVVAVLQSLPTEVEQIQIYTDSKYVVEGATGWIFGWMRNGWQTKAGTDVLNKELWQTLAALLRDVTVDWQKVPGHVGIVGNERADTIASDFGAGKAVPLYNGPRAGYTLAIEQVAYDEAKAAARSVARQRQSQKAYSYVSQVDGVVETHMTWAECEARVKGKKGVRFKKALSAAEEAEIIADFT